MIRSFFIFSALLIISGFAQVKLVKTKVTNSITVSLPKEFYPMTPEDIAQRFPSVRAPLGAYTSLDRVISFSVNQSATRWYGEDDAMAMEFFQASLFNLYDRVDLIDSGIKTIRKNDFIVFEFDSRINGTPGQLGNEDTISSYSYVMYLVEAGRTLVFSFTCPRAVKSQWQPVAHEIMQSIKVR